MGDIPRATMGGIYTWSDGSRSGTFRRGLMEADLNLSKSILMARGGFSGRKSTEQRHWASPTASNLSKPTGADKGVGSVGGVWCCAMGKLFSQRNKFPGPWPQCEQVDLMFTEIRNMGNRTGL